MLEFVHFTGAKSGKDVQTRRKVRSQAMRDFRRRQREEKDPANASRLKQLSRSNSSILLADPERVRSCSDGLLTAHPAVARRSSSQAVAPEGSTLDNLVLVDFVSLSSENGREAPMASAKKNSRPAGPARVQSEASVLSRRRSVRPQRTRQQSPSSAKSPKESIHRIDEASWSPAQVKQMLHYCSTYMRWLRPDSNSGATAAAFALAWEDAKSPMLLAACSLASIGHIGATELDAPSSDCAIYKDRVLQEVAKRMQSPETAVSDETIGGLACLLSFEMSAGSAESITHLHGLRSIVDLKGGIDSPSLDAPLAMMIESLDLIHAVMLGMQPMIAKIEPGTEYDSLSGISAFERLSRIIMIEHEGFRRTAHPAYCTRLESFPKLLADAVDAFGSAPPSTARSDHLLQADAVLNFCESLKEARRMSIERDNAIADAHYLARMCYLEMLVWYNLISRNISPRDGSNDETINGMYDTMRKIDDHTWKQVPYLRLWVLLTGLCGTSEADQKSYFKAELVRSIYQLGISEWRRAKAFILRFIDIAQSLERTTIPATTQGKNDRSVAHFNALDYSNWTSAPAFENLTVASRTPLDYGSGPATCSSSSTIVDMSQTSRMPSPLPPMLFDSTIGSAVPSMSYNPSHANSVQDNSWLDYTDDSLNMLYDPTYWLAE